jgi:hypothetical protein
VSVGSREPVPECWGRLAGGTTTRFPTVADLQIDGRETVPAEHADADESSSQRSAKASAKPNARRISHLYSPTKRRHKRRSLKVLLAPCGSLETLITMGWRSPGTCIRGSRGREEDQSNLEYQKRGRPRVAPCHLESHRRVSR